MLKHIVMWTFKEHAEGADKATNLRRAKVMLDGCADIAPGTVRFEVAIAQSGLECTYDPGASDPPWFHPAPPAARGDQAVHRRGARRAPMHGLPGLSPIFPCPEPYPSETP